MGEKKLLDEIKELTHKVDRLEIMTQRRIEALRIQFTERVERLERLSETHLKAIDMNTALILKIKERDKKKFDGILREVMLETAIREVENDNRP